MGGGGGGVLVIFVLFNIVFCFFICCGDVLYIYKPALGCSRYRDVNPIPTSPFSGARPLRHRGRSCRAPCTDTAGMGCMVACTH